MSSIEEFTEPPAGSPETYLIPAFEGEHLVIPGSKSVFRILASESQTDDTISVFTSGGALADAPGFHHHDHAHDVFLVTRGSLQLYIGDKCRILTAGDFASIPPSIVHNPHILGPVTETLGLIHPASWLDFFRYINSMPEDPFTQYPETDTRNLLASIMPKVMSAPEGKYDVHFHRDFKGAEPAPFDEDDARLPEGTAPYYLKAESGRRWLLGGMLVRPLATTVQTGGRFAIADIQGGKSLDGGDKSVFGDKKWAFGGAHHVFVVIEGKLEVHVDGHEAKTATAGETLFVRKSKAFSVAYQSKIVRFWSFTSGDGIERVAMEAGREVQEMTLPGSADAVDVAKIQEALGKFDAKSA